MRMKMDAPIEMMLLAWRNFCDVECFFVCQAIDHSIGNVVHHILLIAESKCERASERERESKRLVDSKSVQVFMTMYPTKTLCPPLEMPLQFVIVATGFRVDPIVFNSHIIFRPRDT